MTIMLAHGILSRIYSLKGIPSEAEYHRKHYDINALENSPKK
jgi:hypothetical protein